MNKGIKNDLERIITTGMSAHIVANLMKQGITIQEMSRAIKSEPGYIGRVQKKQHSFRFDDVERLARLVDSTPQLLLFNAIRPVPPHLKELFDVTREQLEVSASVDSRFRPKKLKKRRSRSKAA
jgi:hypothetical protein